MASVGRPGRAAAPPSTGGKLLQQYGSTQQTHGSVSFQRGPVASPWLRLGAAIVDGFVIGFLVAPILVGCMFVLAPLFVDAEALQNADNMTQEQRQAAAAAMFGGLMMAYGISAGLAYSVPITIYAIMVTKTGQTPGKKICGVRILDSETGQLPGFVKGVLLRSWVFNVVYCIPLLGPIFALVDQLMIFGSDHKCLHDQVAGTMVVESK